MEVAELCGAGADGGLGPPAQLSGPAALTEAGRAPALPGEETDGLEAASGDEAGLGGGRAAQPPGGLRAELGTGGLGGVVVAGVAGQTSHLQGAAEKQQQRS